MTVALGRGRLQLLFPLFLRKLVHSAGQTTDIYAGKPSSVPAGVARAWLQRRLLSLHLPPPPLWRALQPPPPSLTGLCTSPGSGIICWDLTLLILSRSQAAFAPFLYLFPPAFAHFVQVFHLVACSGVTPPNLLHVQSAKNLDQALHNPVFQQILLSPSLLKSTVVQPGLWVITG